MGDDLSYHVFMVTDRKPEIPFSIVNKVMDMVHTTVRFTMNRTKALLQLRKRLSTMLPANTSCVRMQMILQCLVASRTR